MAKPVIYPPKPQSNPVLQQPGWNNNDDVTPATAYRPPSKRYSQAAADAAQHVYELESERDEWKTKAEKLEGLLQLAEERYKQSTQLWEEREKQLSADLKATQLERDYYQKDSIETKTKLTIAGKIILDVLNESAPADRAQAISAANEHLPPDHISALTESLLHDKPLSGKDDG